LKSDGTVLGWGANTYGQVGDGTNTQRNSAVHITTLSGVAAISAGNYFSVALKTDGLSSGTIWSWGYNVNGQLGDGTSGTGTNKNKPVSGMSSVLSIAAGASHGLAVLSDGSLWAWGDNVSGQIGDGTTTKRALPARALGVKDVLAIAGGASHSVAIKAAGGAIAWGVNSSGQLGDGTSTSRLTAVAVSSFSAASNSWMTTDVDADGLNAAAEYRFGTDPLNADSNGDGISDGAAAGTGRSPTSADVDGDGLSNAAELQAGTDVFRPDTDGDGVLDGADAFPLDPTRSTASPNPGDTTAPVITLQEPTNAVLIP
jgi:hypothetical protein